MKTSFQDFNSTLWRLASKDLTHDCYKHTYRRTNIDIKGYFNNSRGHSLMYQWSYFNCKKEEKSVNTPKEVKYHDFSPFTRRNRDIGA